MSDPVSSELIYAVLQKLQSDVSEIKGDILDLKIRTTAVDEHLSGLMISVSGLNHRMDRLDDRMSRIERRLELTDAK